MKDLNQLQNIISKAIGEDERAILKKERAILAKEGKMNIACLLNELEHSKVRTADYLRAIKEIKKRTGIYGTIYELFVF